MEQKVVLRFRNSSKAGTVAEFPVKQFRSVTIGRDPSCEVAFDSDKDDLVSRLHVKITIEAGNPLSCEISDFGSRNGTFVNHQRLATVAKLMPGDLVQMGAGGPEFEFDIEPRPSGPRPTRLADVIPAAPPTRQADPFPMPSQKVAMGKATVEQRSGDCGGRNLDAAAGAGQDFWSAAAERDGAREGDERIGGLFRGGLEVDGHGDGSTVVPIAYGERGSGGTVSSVGPGCSAGTSAGGETDCTGGAADAAGVSGH
ncbi:MAG: FHA domain-containing protein [Acidobacteria bacterium]|nr:FHA domain-containing protein [Acidobacteriota bacterium]